jgi:hypothetical protein
MYVLRIIRPDYHKKDFIANCLEITEIVALDHDFNRISDLASKSPCIRAEVFEVVIEANKTTSLGFSRDTHLVFRFKDGWHDAYRRIRLMCCKDHGPPYLDTVWVSESHRHYLIEYQI